MEAHLLCNIDDVNIYDDTTFVFLKPVNLDYAINNIMVFDRPIFDQLKSSDDIFKEYKDYREQINVSETYNTLPYWNLDILEKMFYFIKSLIINKSITIKCPFTSNTITTSDYFLTVINNKDIGSADIICNYYFTEDNVIIGFSMASGWNGSNIFPLYIISINNNSIIEIDDVRFYKTQLNIYYYRKICNIAQKMQSSTNDSQLTVKTIYGSISNMGHDLFNHWTGLFLLDYNNLVNKIDSVIMGPYDPYLTSKYFEMKGIQMNMFKNWDSLDGTSGRGVCFKYIHVFMSEKFSDFMLKHLRSCKYLCDRVDTVDEMTPKKLITMNKQVVTFVLRCGERKPYNQVCLIADTINKIIKLFPDIFIIFDGFSRPLYNNIILGSEGNIANIIRDDYIRTVNAISKRIDTTEFKSLIDEPSYICVDWLRLSKISVYICGSGCVNSGWLCKVPGISFGVEHVNIYIEMDKVICESCPKFSYLTNDIQYVNNSPIVSSDILVNELLKLNILR